MAPIFASKMFVATQLIFLGVALVVSSAAEDVLRTRTRKSNEMATSDSQPKRVLRDDQNPSETHHHHHPHHHPHHHHHGGGGGGGGVGSDHSKGAKYFMYAHQPDKHHYEFGYKRGNDHHKIERYEKAGPKGHFKTKVRWHDAHGGHGEQYWDYNHSPKHGEGSDIVSLSGNRGLGRGHHHGYGHGHHGHYSEPVPSIAAAESVAEERTSSDASYNPSKLFKRSGSHKKPTEILKKSYSKRRGNKNSVKEVESREEVAQVPSVFPQTLGFNPYEPPAFAESMRQPSSSSPTEETSAPVNEKPRKTYSRRARRPSKEGSQKPLPKLAFDLDTGKVFDENTGKWFKLVQV